MKLQFVGTVKSESATSVSLSLEGSPVDLIQDGDVWKGTSEPLTVGDTLTGEFRAKGPQGTAWSLEIAIKCPGDKEQKIFSKDDGLIGSSGVSKLPLSIPMPSNPCAKIERGSDV